MAGFLDIVNLHKSFDAAHVINGFNLSVVEGTLLCLIGPNGAGKTTTIDLISGRLKPSSGSIRFRNAEISALGEHEVAQRGFGRKFQIPAVFRAMTVRENLEVAFSHEAGAMRNLFKFRPTGMNARIDEVAVDVGLQDRLNMLAGILSHGETQWLEIGMVLMQKPAVLLLDEPVAGMTEVEIEKTAKMLRGLRGNHTLIVVEHDMGFVRNIADTVTVMHMGALLAQGKIEDIENDPRVREVYLGSEGDH